MQTLGIEGKPSVRGSGDDVHVDIVNFSPGEIVSTDTMNTMYHQNWVGQHIISCLLPDNTADKTCDPNVKNSKASIVDFSPDIVLNPNVRLGNPKGQADTALSNVSSSDIGYIFIDVSEGWFWPGPVSVNRAFLDNLLQRLKATTGKRSDYIGIRTSNDAWLNIMGNWTNPAEDGVMLWYVLLDGEAHDGLTPFGGWKSPSAPIYTQYLEKKTLQGVHVGFNYHDTGFRTVVENHEYK